MPYTKSEKDGTINNCVGRARLNAGSFVTAVGRSWLSATVLRLLLQEYIREAAILQTLKTSWPESSIPCSRLLRETT